MPVHGDNLYAKINASPKYRDQQSQQYLKEIERHYCIWVTENEEIKGPLQEPNDNDPAKIKKRVAAFNKYKDFLDQQKYAEKFDSRSNLHSTVLEEFLEYLFRDLVRELDPSVLVGKSHAFKDIFFKGSNFLNFAANPRIEIEKKDHDFVIGVTVNANFSTNSEQSTDQIHSFDLPIVAIECKTYLDKTMLEGASTAGNQIKIRNPDAMYVICTEWLKLTDAVNLNKFDVDQIYVLRKQKNTDREFRFEETYSKNPIYPDVVEKLFQNVRDHLTRSWATSVAEKLETGILK